VLSKVGAFFMSDITNARSKLANAVKRSRRMPDPDPAAIAEARAALAAAKLEKYVAEVISTAPLLSQDQVRRITALFQGAGGRS
jgi:hypothetical protein